MRILIADDDKDTRLLVSKTLEQWGHEALSAANGLEAWELLQKHQISFVISDWMMPKMDGLELCRHIRATNFPRYIFIILLTAKNDKNDLIEGMEAGADDFIVKPFNRGELKVRIRAGERILNLQKDLEEQNKKLSEAYSLISKDLEAAAEMQQSLLPSTASTISGINFEWIFLPCTFVAGDIFNFFRLDEHHIGFYLLDVAGHGIPAAMQSVTLNKLLSPLPSDGSPLKHFIPNPPHYAITPPAKAIKELNNRFQNEFDAMQYFTMIYGIIHTKDGQIRISQAGHPSPIFIKHRNGVSLIGSGGFPVGMLSDMEYDELEFDFHQGDRLFLYSDGITECTNKQRKQFSVERLMECLQEIKDLPLKEVMRILKQSLYRWRGSGEFDDDVTMLGIERSLDPHLFPTG
ncbi:MAG: PP2C family protein-serine/threonine phosphatase [bacterium]